MKTTQNNKSSLDLNIKKIQVKIIGHEKKNYLNFFRNNKAID